MKNARTGSLLILAVLVWMGCEFRQRPPEERASAPDTAVVRLDTATMDSPRYDSLRFEPIVEESQMGDCNRGFCVEIVMRYPRFASPPLRSAVNALLEGAGRDSLLLYYQRISQEEGVVTTKPWQFERRVKVAHQSPQVLCLEMITYENTGGAHPNGFAQYINLRPANGKVIEWEDVFYPQADTALTRLAEQSFRRKYNIPARQSWKDAGYWFEEEEFYLPRNFGLLEDRIVFQYNSYEIAPHAAGLPEVSLRYQDINTLLRPPYGSAPLPL